VKWELRGRRGRVASGGRRSTGRFHPVGPLPLVDPVCDHQASGLDRKALNRKEGLPLATCPPGGRCLKRGQQVRDFERAERPSASPELRRGEANRTSEKAFFRFAFPVFYPGAALVLAEEHTAAGRESTRWKRVTPGLWKLPSGR